MWVVEVEPEVASWLSNLAPTEFDQAEAAIERLRRFGHRVGMPLSRPLGRGLFELRFQCEGVARRVTFWYADWQPGLIVLLTTFASSVTTSVTRCNALVRRSNGAE